MHLLLSEANHFDENQAYDIRQTAGDIVILSHAATELKVIANEVRHLHEGEGGAKNFPKIRLMHLGYLGHPATIDKYLDDVIANAKIVIVRLLGGESYWQYGMRQLYALCKAENIELIMLSGDNNWDESLNQLSLVHNQFLPADIYSYFCAGGAGNHQSALKLLANHISKIAGGGEVSNYKINPPEPMPDCGIYKNYPPANTKATAKICLFFYRALLQSGDIAALEKLAESLNSFDIKVVLYYLSNFKDAEILADAKEMLAREQPDLIILATGFTLQKSDDGMRPEIFSDFDVPLLQISLSSLPYQEWRAQSFGLPAKEIVMNVALTELDGRIYTRTIAFQAESEIDLLTECPLSHYHICEDRTQFVAKLAWRFIRLGQKKPRDKKLGFVLGNYPASDGRLANGVGLDTPDAVMTLLNEAKKSGILCQNIPENSDHLMALFQEGVTNQHPKRGISLATIDIVRYQKIFQSQIPPSLQQGLKARWGKPEDDIFVRDGVFHLPFLIFGNVAVGLQIARGYDLDPDAYCHDPALVPPHGYLAFYFWLEHIFGIDCLTHIGKHGTLEWLPGKSLALSENCWSDAILGPMPLFYPFIVNDPGEGTQAKRRSQAVILDHLPPVIQTSGLYGEMAELENLMDEYYEARNLDPKRKLWLEQEIITISNAMNLEIGEMANGKDAPSEGAQLVAIETWLCDIKFTMIRKGLHRYGQMNSELPEMMLAFLRHKRGDAPHQASLLQSFGQELGLDFDIFDSENYHGETELPEWFSEGKKQVTISRRKLVDKIYDYALTLLQDKTASSDKDFADNFPQSQIVLDAAQTDLKPLILESASNEKAAFRDAIAGKFIPAGASGAPSRGRLDVLPTGRNFYSLDLRAIPSEAAWALGQKSADLLLKTHLQNHGVPLSEIVLSLWGTAQMRTGGDDIAQAMALMGVRPIRNLGRVTGFEVTPLNILARTRVDVTFKISGFFRDAFPNVVKQLAQIVSRLAESDEPFERNPIAANYQNDLAKNLTLGLSEFDAALHAKQRIFGSAPGTYGAGLQHLIANGNWESDEDFAKIFLKWGGYAYDGDTIQGDYLPQNFQARLARSQAVIHNQDNREHDILDSDDYYQFAGGLAASIRHFSKSQPEIYHNDHSNPDRPQIGTLRKEIARIVRARAANPKWLESIMQHGYKGAFEIAATVEYLFAFAATAKTVEEHHFDALFQAYLEDETVLDFLKTHNPQALNDILARFDEAIARALWNPKRNSVLPQLAKLQTNHNPRGADN